MPYAVGKRAFDIVISAILIVGVLSWLIPLLAVLIKLDSRGPVFFVQRRGGRYGKSFLCFKLRSMVVNEQSDLVRAVSGDTRVTRFGHFLRRTSLDELPQFIHVLFGRMSIVGPRPFMRKDDEEFSLLVENYSFRYQVRPGITGMAQVKGYRGPALTFHEIFHRYQWDAFYVRNSSPSLDLRIMRLTAVQICQSLLSFLRRPAKSGRGSLTPAFGR